MMSKIDAILVQCSVDDGIKKDKIIRLLDELELEADEEVDPIYLEADSAWVFGFIRDNIAEEVLNFDCSQESRVAQAAIQVVNDMTLETESQIYDFAGVRTKLCY